MEDAGQTTRDAARGVGVITEVHGFEDAFGKGVDGQQTPNRSDERVQNVAAGFNFMRRLPREIRIQQRVEMSEFSVRAISNPELRCGVCMGLGGIISTHHSTHDKTVEHSGEF